MNAGEPLAALDACDAAEAALATPLLALARRGQILYHHLDQSDAAEACFQGVLAADGAHASAHDGLARIAFDRLYMKVARRHAGLALEGVDDRAALWPLMWVLGDYKGAITLWARPLASEPADVDVLITRARAFYLLRRYDEALAMFARAAEHNPRGQAVNFGLAELLLMSGDARAGWRRFDHPVTEEVLQAVPAQVRPSLKTYWRGEPLAGKRILMVNFLGIGDNIMMVRFARVLKARGAHITFCCRPELYRLFKGLEGVDDLRASYLAQPWDALDCWTFDYMLPRWLGPSENAIPALVGGYVDAPAIAPDLTPRAGASAGWSLLVERPGPLHRPQPVLEPRSLRASGGPLPCALVRGSEGPVQCRVRRPRWS